MPRKKNRLIQHRSNITIIIKAAAAASPRRRARDHCFRTCCNQVNRIQEDHNLNQSGTSSM